MRRVVITGTGIISPLGSSACKLTRALEHATSAVRFAPDFEAHNFKSRVHAPITQALPELSRQQERFMGKGNTLRYGYHAMQRAVASSGLTADEVASPNVGCLVGTGGPSTLDQTNASDTLRETGPRKIGPFAVVPTMSSGLSAKIATDFGIQGMGFTITSACATSAHCIGIGALLIQNGLQDIVFAGGSEDAHPTKACGFDAMGALSSNFNDTPEVASRAFDVARDGFVDGEAGAVLVLEEYEHAKRRGANIIAELVGFGATSDGEHMTNPSGEGARRCMEMALRGFDGMRIPRVDYINTHGTSTPAGDIAEMRAINEIWYNSANAPWINSTKSLHGHALGATGAQEAILTILQLRTDTVAQSAHIDEIDPEITALGPIAQRITRETTEGNFEYGLSNSFGFGGTNATLVFRISK